MSKLANFNITLPAQQAKTGAPLSPLLGQYGLSCQEFCNAFNSKTKEISQGIPVRILFRVLPDKKFEFSITRLVFGELLRQCGLSRQFSRTLSILTFFKLFVLTRGINCGPEVNYQLGNSKQIKRELQSLVHSLKGVKLKIK